MSAAPLEHKGASVLGNDTPPHHHTDDRTDDRSSGEVGEPVNRKSGNAFNISPAGRLGATPWEGTAPSASTHQDIDRAMSSKIGRAGFGNSGSDMIQQRSRFLEEIPSELIEEWNLRTYS